MDESLRVSEIVLDCHFCIGLDISLDKTNLCRLSSEFNTFLMKISPVKLVKESKKNVLQTSI